MIKDFAHVRERNFYLYTKLNVSDSVSSSEVQ